MLFFAKDFSFAFGKIRNSCIFAVQNNKKKWEERLSSEKVEK